MVVMFQVLPRCSHAIGGNRPILVLQPKDNKTWGGRWAQVNGFVVVCRTSNALCNKSSVIFQAWHDIFHSRLPFQS